MEIVIKISKEDYNNIEAFLNGETINGGFNLFKVLEIIKKGTPLPKGHGDLKDTEKLKKSFITWSKAVQGSFTDADIASIIYNSPTIIKADKESDE